MCNGDRNDSAATGARTRATADAATAAGARAKATAAAAATGARTRATAAAAMAGARAKASLARQRASSVGSYSANNLVCRLVCRLVRHLVKVVAARGRRAAVAGGNLDQLRCINLCRGRCRTRRAQTSVCTTPVRRRTAPTSFHSPMSLSRPPRMGASCGPPSKIWSQVKATATPALLNRVPPQYRCRQRRARKRYPPASSSFATNRSRPPDTTAPRGPPSESRRQAKVTTVLATDKSRTGTGVVSAQRAHAPPRAHGPNPPEEHADIPPPEQTAVRRRARQPPTAPRAKAAIRQRERPRVCRPAPVSSAPSAGTAPSATTSVCKRTAPTIPHSEPQMPDGQEQ